MKFSIIFSSLITFATSINFEFKSTDCSSTNKSGYIVVCQVHDGMFLDLGFNYTRKLNKVYVCAQLRNDFIFYKIMFSVANHNFKIGKQKVPAVGEVSSNRSLFLHVWSQESEYFSEELH